MVKTKNYKEKLEDLEAGLKRLDNMIPKKYSDYDRIRRAREIQETRIDSFKDGYALRDREIVDQKTLSLGVKK